jgi:hypothetical protein
MIYIEVEINRALAQWRHDCIIWQMRAMFSKRPGKKPTLPPILKRLAKA